MQVITSGAKRVKMKMSPGTPWALMRRNLGWSVACQKGTKSQRRKGSIEKLTSTFKWAVTMAQSSEGSCNRSLVNDVHLTVKTAVGG